MLNIFERDLQPSRVSDMSNSEIFVYEREGNSLIVVPQGDLFQYRYEDLRNGYNEMYRMLNEPDTVSLIIDFSRTEHFGSAFIGMLIKLARECRRGGGDALLCGLSKSMREVLDSLMLLENVTTDFFWVPYDSRAEALAALN